MTEKSVMSLRRLCDQLERLAGSRLSRRGTLAATAAGLITTLVGDKTQGAMRHPFATAASPPPPIPPASFDFWPACSPEREHYCVAAFSVDGVDQLAAADPDFAAGVL